MRAVLICAVLAALSPTYAEAAERIWRMGVLTPVEDNAVRSVILPYLATRGFVEGRNLVVDFRIGAIVAAPMGADPVLAGVAESWAHPGGNVTGVSLIAPELEIKRLSLLREVLPSVHRIAVLSNHRKVVEAGLLPLRKAAAEVGLELVEIWVESPTEYATAFDRMRGVGAEAVVIVPTPESYRDTELLAALAAKTRLPAIGGSRESAQRGLLIGYGPSLRELGRRVGVDPTYLSRIQRGKKRLPANLPERVAAALELPSDYFPESRERIILEAIRREPRLRELVYATIAAQSSPEA